MSRMQFTRSTLMSFGSLLSSLRASANTPSASVASTSRATAPLADGLTRPAETYSRQRDFNVAQAAETPVESNPRRTAIIISSPIGIVNASLTPGGSDDKGIRIGGVGTEFKICRDNYGDLVTAAWYIWGIKAPISPVSVFETIER